MSKRQLGQIVKHKRLNRAWTQVQLAEIAGISLRTVQRLEANGTASQETLLAIANAFDVDVADLTCPPSPPSFHQEVKEPLPQNPTIMVLPDNPSFSRTTLFWGTGAYAALVLTVVMLTYIFFPADAYPLEINGKENLAAVGYKKFLHLSTLVLSMGLGFWAAFYGAVSKRWFFGVLVLGVGVVFSVGAYALLPWLQYPSDQYSPGAIWLFVGLAPLVIAWSLVNIGFVALRKL